MLLGGIVSVIGTALTPRSERVTLAALVGLLLIGIGAISVLYGLVAR